MFRWITSNRWVAVAACLLIGVIIAVGGRSLLRQPSQPQPQAALLVSAAASLQDVLTETNALFEQAHPLIKVTANFGASGALQQQIEQGGSADVLIAAAARPMDALQTANLILPGSRRNLVTNRLVLVVPANSSLGLASFQQLSDPAVQRISVGEFRSVPAGQYAEEVFRNLAILDALRPKLVFANNVRAVLAAVASGNVDAGIVYRTDARSSDRVRQVATASASLHSAIVYPMAIISRSRNAQAAQTYTQFLSSPDAQSIFERYGFGLP